MKNISLLNTIEKLFIEYIYSKVEFDLVIKNCCVQLMRNHSCFQMEIILNIEF